MSFTFLLLLITSIICCTYLYFYCKKRLNYWSVRNVANLQPKTPLGDLINCIYNRENLFLLLRRLHEQFKRNGHRYFGFYFTLGPIFVPIDSDLIKRILATDYDYFNERDGYVDKENIPLSDNIICVDGNRWKYLREMITSALSPAKVNGMTKVVDNYSNTLCDAIDNYNGDPVNVQNLALRYTVDIACNVYMGVEMDCLLKKESTIIDFANIANKCGLMNVLKVCLRAGTTKPGNLLMSILIEKNANAYFKGLIRKVYEMKKKDKVIRQDAMTDFMRCFEDEGEDFDFRSLIGQMFALVGGTFETNSSVMTYALYELGKSKQYQEMLRKEISEATSKEGHLTSEAILDMQFLDRFLNEVLRVHPIIPILNRKCVKDYQVPDSNLIVEKGTSVLISTYAIHNDPDIFPYPERFDPDRFYDNKQTMSLMAFSNGQKQCPGKKLGVILVKHALAKIVQKFDITVNEMTGDKLEIVGFSKHVVWKYKNTFWMNFKKIQ